MLTFSEQRKDIYSYKRDLMLNDQIIGEWYVLHAMQSRYGNFSLNETGKNALGVSVLWFPNCDYHEALARVQNHLKPARDCDLLVQNGNRMGLYELFDLENDAILFTGTLEQCYTWKNIIEDALGTNGG